MPTRAVSEAKCSAGFKWSPSLPPQLKNDLGAVHRQSEMLGTAEWLCPLPAAPGWLTALGDALRH